MHVEIWSDIACPWCYIGKRRFEEALAGFEHRDDVTVSWRSFELDPAAPRRARGDRAEHLAAKYGATVDEARADAGQDDGRGRGRGARLPLRHRARGQHVRRPSAAPPRRRARRAGRVKERLMRAYLTEGELISDHATLERIGVDAGLPAAEVRDMLAGDRYTAEVRDDESTGAALGISGVPFFVVDRRDRRIRRAAARVPAQPARAGLGAARAEAVRGRGRRVLRRRRLLRRPAPLLHRHVEHARAPVPPSVARSGWTSAGCTRSPSRSSCRDGSSTAHE